MTDEIQPKSFPMPSENYFLQDAGGRQNWVQQSWASNGAGLTILAVAGASITVVGGLYLIYDAATNAYANNQERFSKALNNYAVALVDAKHADQIDFSIENGNLIFSKLDQTKSTLYGRVIALIDGLAVEDGQTALDIAKRLIEERLVAKTKISDDVREQAIEGMNKYIRDAAILHLVPLEDIEEIEKRIEDGVSRGYFYAAWEAERELGEARSKQDMLDKVKWFIKNGMIKSIMMKCSSYCRGPDKTSFTFESL